MRALLIVGLLMITGCESNPFKPDRSNEVSSSGASGSELVCTKERGVGTHISKRVCRTRAQIEQEEEDARRAMDTIRNQPGAISNP